MQDTLHFNIPLDSVYTISFQDEKRKKESQNVIIFQYTYNEPLVFIYVNTY